MTKRERNLCNMLILAIAALLIALITLVVIKANAIDGKPECPQPVDQGQRVIIYAVPDGFGGLKSEVHYQPIGFVKNNLTSTKR